jgi:D-lactate dehydrogenase
MKVVAYSIKPFEKEYLAKANQKRHDITLISNALSLDTASYAAGKEAVIVVTNDDVSAKVINKLASLGVRYIITRSSGTDQIDKAAAARHGIKWANVPAYSPQAIAEHAVVLALALSRHLIEADRDSHKFDFRNDNLIGFNFYGKTVGLIGLGHTGLAVASIYNGMGCRVIAYDPIFPVNAPGIESVGLEKLLAEADIISLHLPLSASSKHLINQATLDQMKDGVMLINTSRGAIVNTIDAIAALEKGKLGYLGLDVYEFEKGLFYEDHEDDVYKDPLLEKLMHYKNVLITPHQAYLTKEALQEIADQTIKNLDIFNENTAPLIAEL